MADSNYNQQTADASSETDSVVSLVYRARTLSLDGSSSPIESTDSSENGAAADTASSGGSDMNDDTIVKVSEVIEDEEEKAIAFFDKNGNLCDENTPSSNFKDWNEYLSFCNQGPQLKVRTAVHNDNGDIVRYHKASYSKKLLCDFGEYFCAMYRVKMLESTTGVVDFDDISYKDFNRLMLVIMAGGPAAKPNLGPAYHTMGIYMEVYILADRFMMPMVKAWATAAMEEYMRGNVHWATTYQQQVVDHPDAIAAEVVHQEMLLDFNDCWVRSEYLSDDNRPVQQTRIVQFLLNYCPRVLMHSMMPQLHAELVREICTALLAV